MGNGGNCVEVAAAEHAVFVRDSKDADGPAFGCGREPWLAFVTGLRDDRNRAPAPPGPGSAHGTGRLG
jgi:hypothetical protein